MTEISTVFGCRELWLGDCCRGGRDVFLEKHWKRRCGRVRQRHSLTARVGQGLKLVGNGRGREFNVQDNR